MHRQAPAALGPWCRDVPVRWPAGLALVISVRVGPVPPPPSVPGHSTPQIKRTPRGACGHSSNWMQSGGTIQGCSQGIGLSLSAPQGEGHHVPCRQDRVLRPDPGGGPGSEAWVLKTPLVGHDGSGVSAEPSREGTLCPPAPSPPLLRAPPARVLRPGPGGGPGFLGPVPTPALTISYCTVPGPGTLRAPPSPGP